MDYVWNVYEREIKDDENFDLRSWAGGNAISYDEEDSERGRFYSKTQ